MKTTLFALFFGLVSIAQGAPARDSLSVARTDDSGKDNFQKFDQDGLYVVSVDDNGKETTQYLGLYGDSQPKTVSADSSKQVHARSDDVGVHCGDTRPFNETDLGLAFQGLANVFNTKEGYNWETSYSIRSTVAYACDYAHGQTNDYDTAYSDLEAVLGACGSGREGWYAHGPEKNSIGYAYKGDRFCH